MSTRYPAVLVPTKRDIINETLGQFPTGFVASEPDFFPTRSQPVTQPR